MRASVPWGEQCFGAVLEVGYGEGLLAADLDANPRVTRRVSIECDPDLELPDDVLRGRFPLVPQPLTREFDCVTLHLDIVTPELLLAAAHRLRDTGGAIFVAGSETP